ncbi:MAG TPA: hypothetical protein VJ860_21890 [Polyangia bacterium]|nr:hypothetical protein [Polyangia bacterium]
MKPIPICCIQRSTRGEKTLYGKTSEGVIRSTAIVDPAGRIAHHFPKVSAEGHAAEVQAKLAELRR